MIPTMIMSFLIVGAMFFLTANEKPKSHHEIKEPIVVKTKEVVSQKKKSIEVVEAQKVEAEVIVVSETPKSKKKVMPVVKKVEKIVSSQNDKSTKEESPISKVEISQKKIILPTIPTVPKVKNYEIKIPVPEKSLTPVEVSEI